MTQKRMNNLMLIVSVYKEDADNLNLLDVANDFYDKALTVSQNLDTFQKLTYVKLLAN